QKWLFKNQNRKKENQMNKEQAFQTLDSLVYAMEKLENESIRSEDNEELEQMLALMNRDWHELYTIYGKAWEEYRKNALEK
ncbi:hypothetical protein, partial [Enterococcus faecalis]